jgi:hypothetical protein
MQKTLDLPTELWMDTIKTLASPDLKAISLACKRFRALAAPHLFRRLHLAEVDPDGEQYWACCPSGYDAYAEPLTSSTLDHLLEFYGSGMIAPLVREFQLDRYRVPSLLDIGVVLALLRRLPRLDRIVFLLSDLDAYIMHTLEQLPALTSFSMQFCPSYNTGIPRLRLKSLELLGPPYRLHSPCPFTIDPDILESLSIGEGAFPATSCLPNLRTLSVSNHSSMPSIVSCLDFLMHCSCPSLKTLDISSNRMEYELPANIYGLPKMPCLQQFRGPIRLAPFFATGGSLRDVRLSERTETFVIIDVLHKLLPLAPNLVTLMVDVPYVEESILRAALSFSHLEELCLRSTSNEKISVKACRRSPHLPASLLIG